jgi:zinc protease
MRFHRIFSWMIVKFLLLSAFAAAANAPVAERNFAVKGAGSAAARFGLKFEPVSFTPPKVDHVALANNLPLDFYPDPGLPLVNIMVRVGTGSIHDPQNKIGAAEMTGQVVRNGGTAKYPGDELDRQLESRGAELTVTTDKEETWFRLSILREDLAWGLNVLADLLISPTLPAEKLEEARGPRIVELQQRLDVPMKVASVLFPQLVYGKGNPWGATPTEKTMRALSIDDLRSMISRFYRTGNMQLGMSGGIDFAEARRLADESFGKLPVQPYTPPAMAEVKPIEKTEIFIVPREVTQNVIYLGHEGINRLDPRKFQVRVFNNVLAGGFTSRLFQEVRSNRGLAYSVHGRIGEGTQKGIYYNAAMTKTPSTAEALKLMLKINGDLQREPPRPDEMDVAVQSDVNAFVFFFDRGDKIVQQQITLNIYHYPPDYLAAYVSNLKSVEPEQVRLIATELLHLDKILVLVVGNPTPELKTELQGLGPITEISDEELRKSWL